MSIEQNKAVVRRFNREVIEEGNEASFHELMAADFVNCSAPPGTPNGPDSMWNTFHDVLRSALSGLTVTILDQIGEDERVTTRKTISGTHTGTFMGIAATGKPVSIDVIDIVRVRNGQYAEHWGINTLPSVLAQLKGG